ncbi:MAG: hypothetical protein N3G21_10280 [Candidatus Hydrogenedentes bacterium]|nr:hypothetical protein [Candidatus Hydrogenedentota bacterium]
MRYLYVILLILKFFLAKAELEICINRIANMYILKFTSLSDIVKKLEREEIDIPIVYRDLSLIV